MLSTHLLVNMSSIRYQGKKEEAWKWEDTLTPYGIKLRDAAFDDINYRHYMMNIEEADQKWICRLTRVGQGNSERTCFFLKYLEQGSAFCGCSCGLPYTVGVPCHHIVAVVKAMPYWWSTACWRNQYSVDTNVTCNFYMEVLRATTLEDRTMRYCPPYAAARKAGCPKLFQKIEKSIKRGE